MKSSTGERRTSAGSGAPPVELAGVDPAIWVRWSESAMLESMKWVDVWLQGTQRFWSAGLRAFGPLGGVPANGRRRTADLAWVPQVEAQVIPLRRKTDEPGTEATRISMRLPMPWTVGGAEVISFEAIVGRRHAAADALQEGDDFPTPKGRQG